MADVRPGFISFLVSGVAASRTFEAEAGGHRWQRIPPTERRNRVQTSTVTVAVLDVKEATTGLNLKDVEITPTRGSGPGGQHKNKTESCVVAVHQPTGIRVRIDLRSQHRSREVACRVIAARLKLLQSTTASAEENSRRRQQVGSGMRGDKIRTYREQDDQVIDHRTGRRWRLSSWMRGEW